ncbi:MAG: TonB family protein [Candidatus Krumholzibacteriia bacterium]|jgi:TonB family protein
MNLICINQEFGLMRHRFQRTLAISVGLHIALFAAMVFLGTRQSPPAPVVDITWLAQEMTLIPIIETVPVEEVMPEVVGQEHVKAEEPVLTVKQKLAQQATAGDAALAEQMQKRLQALGDSQVADKAMSLVNSASANLVNTAPATMAPKVSNNAPTNLNRGGGEHKPAVALVRGPSSSHQAAALVSELPSGGSATSAATPGTESSASRDLGGASLAGPVADRKVIDFMMPNYPAWATAQGVEATVTLYFLVMPSGHVKENIQVQRTAGYKDFDAKAVAALQDWRFAALSESDGRQQWGTITFRFRLSD